MTGSASIPANAGLQNASMDPRFRGDTRENARIDAAAKDFEAVFIAQMLAPLFSSVETPAIAGGGKSEEFFKSLLQEGYAKAMAERGGFGIAAHVKSTLINLQSAMSAATPQETRP